MRSGSGSSFTRYLRDARRRGDWHESCTARLYSASPVPSALELIMSLSKPAESADAPVSEVLPSTEPIAVPPDGAAPIEPTASLGVAEPALGRARPHGAVHLPGDGLAEGGPETFGVIARKRPEQIVKRLHRRSRCWLLRRNSRREFTVENSYKLNSTCG